MLGTDFVGISALVGSIAAAIVSIIVAFRQTGTQRAIGDVHDEVKTGNGKTIGMLADAIETRRTDAVEADKGK